MKPFRTSERIRIPNIIHFVMIHKVPETANPLTFMQMIAIMSAAAANEPLSLYLHTNAEPYGQWWEFLRPLVTVRFISEIPTSWGSKPIIQGAHLSDRVRMDILLEEGGIYLDFDVISLRPYRTLWTKQDGSPSLDGRGIPVEMIMGKEKENGLCNAVMISAPNSTFLNIWKEEYEAAFDPKKWNEASVLLPKIISLKFPEMIKVVPESAFFLPSFTHTHLIFEDKYIELSENAYAQHLWSAPHIQHYMDPLAIWPMRSPPRNLFEKMIRFLAMNTSTWNSTIKDIFNLNSIVR